MACPLRSSHHSRFRRYRREKKPAIISAILELLFNEGVVWSLAGKCDSFLWRSGWQIGSGRWPSLPPAGRSPSVPARLPQGAGPLCLLLSPKHRVRFIKIRPSGIPLNQTKFPPRSVSSQSLWHRSIPQNVRSHVPAKQKGGLWCNDCSRASWIAGKLFVGYPYFNFSFDKRILGIWRVSFFLFKIECGLSGYSKCSKINE